MPGGALSGWGVAYALFLGAIIVIVSLRTRAAERKQDTDISGSGEIERPRQLVEASPEASAFVREHGGRLYVWADAGVLRHVTTEPPEHAVEFVRFADLPFEFFVAPDIKAPDYWRVVLHRFPRRHVDALWNGQDASVGDGPGIYG